VNLIPAQEVPTMTFTRAVRADPAHGDHLLPSVEAIVGDLLEEVTRKAIVERRAEVPEDFPGPSRKPNKWLEIPNVSCVYVDMVGSTELSRTVGDRTMGAIYQAFTGGAVRIFHELDARYIDVRGDGAFGLFNERQVYRALVSAVSIKTYVNACLAPKVKKEHRVALDAHMGIHRGNLLVRKVGLERRGGSPRQNEVWAGGTVSTTAKLASLAHENRLIVSMPYYLELTDKRATHSCGCGTDAAGYPTMAGDPRHLWGELDLSTLPDDKPVPTVPENKVMVLKSSWCERHGAEFAAGLLKEDGG
jgi:class 3 adenylate cyclase